MIGQRYDEAACWPIHGEIGSITNEHFSKRVKFDETHPRSDALAQDRHTTVASEAKITSFARPSKLLGVVDQSRIA